MGFALYWTFVLYSFLFFYCAVVALYYLLRILEFDPRASLLGGVFFLLSPPVLLAYKYPVYTREDPLAYFLLVLGLIAILRWHVIWVAVIAALAALTRETTLLLPLVYFLASGASWVKRMIVCAVPFLALAGIRVLWGFTQGNNFDSSIANFQAPFETIAFTFCVFGVLWFPYIAGLHDRWTRAELPNEAWRVLTTTGPVVLVGMLAATLVLSRAREVRIAYIIFPWAIPFALDWLRRNAEYLRTLAVRPGFWISTGAILLVLSAAVLYFHLTNADQFKYYFVDFKNGYWLAIGTIHLTALLALALPMVRRPAAVERIGDA